MIYGFKNTKYAFLSNFWWFRNPDTGSTITAEHLYQAAKTNDRTWRDRIIRAASPGEAKRLGNRCPIIQNWEKIREEVMLITLRKKFKSSKKLTAMLLDTHPQELVEANTWHDNYWGQCTCDRCAEVDGENKLGKLLMRVRDELRNNQ